jgi:hypothetical protein
MDSNSFTGLVTFIAFFIRIVSNYKLVDLKPDYALAVSYVIIN